MTGAESLSGGGLNGRPPFQKTWWRWNVTGFVLGYLPYTPIAHGVTGSHTRDLTPAQFAAHCVALVVVSLVVSWAQQRALPDHVRVTALRRGIGAVLFVVAFWIGYYLPWNGPDLDMILGFLVLGSSTWFGTAALEGRFARGALAALAFPVAGVLGEIVLVLGASATGSIPDVQGSDLVHSFFWLFLATWAGVLGGWLSGRLLAPAFGGPGTD